MADEHVEVTPEDIELIKEEFNKADKGGGGKITTAALAQIFHSIEGEEPWSEQDLADLFKLIGVTKDGFVKYDHLVNYVMQDEEEDDEIVEQDNDHAGDADELGLQRALEDVQVDINERITRKMFLLIARRLGEDVDEAGDMFDHQVNECRARGDSVDYGIPLFELLEDMHVEDQDKEAMKMLRDTLVTVREKMYKGEDDPPEELSQKKGWNIGFDKIVRELMEKRRPVEDAKAVLEEGNIYLSSASKRLLSSLDTATLIEKVRSCKLNPPALSSSAGQVGCREHCEAKVARIIAECRAAGKKFTDPEWDILNKPNEVLYVDKTGPGYDCTVGKPHAYKRLSEIVHDVKLMKDGVRPGDIIQGQIGTCFLLGALGAVVSNNPHAIKKQFLKYDVEVGVYGVCFNVDGEWVYTIIDDIIPVNQYGNPSYASCRDKQEVWTCLLEKAFCKLHTCYEMCDGGRPSEAIFSFFGGTSGRFLVDKKYKANPRAYFKVLKQAKDRGMLLTTGFNPPKKGSLAAQGKCGEAVLPSGLVGGHVYSVLRLVEAQGECLVQCRNPWGTGEWTGKFSDKNLQNEWTPELLKVAGEIKKNDGKFWMSIEDFVKDSTGVDFARVFGPQWKKITHYKHFRKADLHAVAKWAYKAGEDNEIGFKKGDEIEVLNIHKGWWYGRTVGSEKKGFFPGNYVGLKDRPVARFDLHPSPEAGATEMSAVIMLMQPNSKMQRKFFKRKSDGLNYKDIKYPRMQLTVVGPDGKVRLKKEGCRRELSGEIQVDSREQLKIYCLAVDGTGSAFVMRTYIKGGTAEVREVENASVSEIAHAYAA